MISCISFKTSVDREAVAKASSEGPFPQRRCFTSTPFKETSDD